MSEEGRQPQEVTEEQARRYARRRHLMALAHLLAGLAFLLVMLFWGTKPLAELVEGAVSGTLLQTGLYALLFLLLYQILIFPLDYYTGFLLEHEFGLSRQTFPAWLWHKAKQAALTLGAGGILGTGLGEGRQKLFFLPYPHTDFIFAATGEDDRHPGKDP